MTRPDPGLGEKRGKSPLFSRLRIPPSKAALGAAARALERVQSTEPARRNDDNWLKSIGDIRIVLLVIATIAVVACLHYAKDFLVPIVAALVIAACLGPVDNRVRRVIPSDSMSAAVTILATLLAFGGGVYLMSDDISLALEQLPDISRQLKAKMSVEDTTSNPVKKIAEAAQNIEDATNAMSGPAPAPGTTSAKSAAVAKPEPAAPARPAWLRSQLLLGSTTLIQGVVQLAASFLIAYFILASGPVLRRKLFRASGTHRRHRARFRRILDQSCHQVRMYVVIVLVTNVAIGLASWGAFHLMGFEHAGLWAIFASIVHVVPYIGSLALASAAAVFHYVTSPDVFQSVMFGVIVLMLASLIGTLLPND